MLPISVSGKGHLEKLGSDFADSAVRNALGYNTSISEPSSRPILILVALVFVLKTATLVFLYWRAPQFFDLVGDMSDYDLLADAVLQGGYAETPSMALIRAPGYPIALAGVRAVLGKHALVVPIVHAGLSAVMMYWVFRVTLLLAGERYAYLAAAIQATDSVSFYYVSTGLTETLFAFLLTAFVYLLAVTIGRIRSAIAVRDWLWPAALAGIVLTAALLVRHAVYFYPFLIVVLIAAAAFLGWLPKVRAVVVVALILLPFAGTVLAWRAYNFEHYGVNEIRLYGTHLYYWRAPSIVARRDGISRNEAFRRLSSIVPAEVRHDHLAAEEYYRKYYWDLVRENPFAALEDAVKGSIKVLLAPGQGPLQTLFQDRFGEKTGGLDFIGLDAFKGNPSLLQEWIPRVPGYFALLAFAMAYTFVVAGLALASVFALRKMKSEERMLYGLLAMTASYIILIAASTMLDSRFRVPAAPMLSVLAAVGMQTLVGFLPPGFRGQASKS